MVELTAILHKLRQYITYLVAVFFLVPILWTSYLIALWALISIVLVFVEVKEIKKLDIKNTVFYSIPFVLFFISIQLHGGGGGAILERQMSFFVFPICVFLSRFKLSLPDLRKLTIAFVIGCCLLAIKGPFMYMLIGPHVAFSEQHDFIYRYRTEFSINTGISPTYACLYFGFAIILMIIQAKEFTRKWVVVLSIVFLFFNMVILSAKMPFLAVSFILVFLLIRKQVRWKLNSKKSIAIGTVVFLVGVIALMFFTRWGELIAGFNPKLLNNKESSVDVRRYITQCDLELTKQYFLLGTGPQHLQKKLDQCYYQFEGNAFARNRFNTHNQYFDYLLSHGLIGLVLLLTMMIVPLYQSIRGNDPIMMSFIILIILCMLTENILSRQAGIVFYGFFNALLLNRKIES